MSYKVIGDANHGYIARQEVIDWIRSEAGQEALSSTSTSAEENLQELHESRRLSHEDLYSPVTI